MAPVSGNEPSRNLITRLIAGRVALVTLLLGTLTLIQLYRPHLLPFQGSVRLYWVIIATYVLSLAYLAAVVRGVTGAWFLRFQFAVDTCLVTVVIGLSGGIDSPFSFLYPTLILAAAVLMQRHETFIVATLSIISYSAIVLLQYHKPISLLLPKPPVTPTSDFFVNYSIFLSFMAFFLVAFLADYLSNSLRRTGRELARHRENLANLQAQTRHIFTSLISGLLITDLTGRVVAINPAGEQILGLDTGPAPLGGISLSSLFRGRGGLPEYVAQPGEDSLRTDFHYDRPGGKETILLGLTISRLLTDRGEHTGFLAIFQDLTPMHAMEEEVRKAQRLAAIGEMAAGLAHELKNPLAPISGSVEMLREKVRPEDRPLIDLILRETNRLVALVNNFLQYARPLPLTLKLLDLNSIIAEVVELFKREKRVSGRISLVFSPGPMESAFFDPRMIHQVLWNLLANAVEAITPPGSITVASTELKGRIQVSIADSGEGIPEERMKHIFTPFYTTKEKGTGLGLAMCERIISLHGGTITVTSRPGEGSTFTFTLPHVSSNSTPKEGLHAASLDTHR